MKLMEIDLYEILNPYIEKLTEGEMYVFNREELMRLLNVNQFKLDIYMYIWFSDIRQAEVNEMSTIYVEIKNGIILSGIYDTAQKYKSCYMCLEDK